MEVTTNECRGKALLVEDEYLVALHIAGILEGAGFNVVGPAARLSEAVRLAESEAELRFAVLDVNLAGERSWPVARLLSARGIPFIFITGYPEAHAEVPGDLDGTPFLSKPVEPYRVTQIIRTLAEL